MVYKLVQWHCEILILVHFASDGICLILKHNVLFWVATVLLLNIKTKSDSSFINVTVKTLMVYTYGSVILRDLNFGSFWEWRNLQDLEAYGKSSIKPPLSNKPPFSEEES